MSASSEQLLEQILKIEKTIKEENTQGNNVDELKKNLAQLRELFNESISNVTTNEKLLKG